MFKLDQPSTSTLNEYFDLIKEKIFNRNTSKILTNIEIENVIKATPLELLKLNNDILANLGIKSCDIEFKRYLEIRNKTGKKYETEKTKLNTKYHCAEELFKLFNYETIIQNEPEKVSYKLAELLNRNTCTYCNRQYTLTIKKEKEDKYVTRPEFDHWFSQKDYPVLALSFYNLIPSCKICNSTIKGQKELTLEKHIHPYISEEGQDFLFSYQPNEHLKFEVIINVSENSKMDNTLKFFKTKDIYNAHAELELKDLIDLKQKYSSDYLKFIFELFDKSVSTQEISRMVFGIEMEANDHHKRPLSKFKSDIIKKLLSLK